MSAQVEIMKKPKELGVSNFSVVIFILADYGLHRNR